MDELYFKSMKLVDQWMYCKLSNAMQISQSNLCNHDTSHTDKRQKYHLLQQYLATKLVSLLYEVAKAN